MAVPSLVPTNSELTTNLKRGVSERSAPSGASSTYPSICITPGRVVSVQPMRSMVAAPFNRCRAGVSRFPLTFDASRLACTCRMYPGFSSAFKTEVKNCFAARASTGHVGGGAAAACTSGAATVCAGAVLSCAAGVCAALGLGLVAADTCGAGLVAVATATAAGAATPVLPNGAGAGKLSKAGNDRFAFACKVAAGGAFAAVMGAAGRAGAFAAPFCTGVAWLISGITALRLLAVVGMLPAISMRLSVLSLAADQISSNATSTAPKLINPLRTRVGCRAVSACRRSPQPASVCSSAR